MKTKEIEDNEKELLESFEKKEKEINLSMREEENSNGKLEGVEPIVKLEIEEETKKENDEMEKA